MALVVSWVFQSSLDKFMSVLADGYIVYKSSLSFCIFSTIFNCHPTPIVTASFPHNPSLWLLFRVGPGDGRRLTECICVCVCVCVCVHSCVLWKQSRLNTTVIQTWPWMVGWLKWRSEWGHFDLGLCEEKARSLLFRIDSGYDQTWSHTTAREHIWHYLNI